MERFIIQVFQSRRDSIRRLKCGRTEASNRTIWHRPISHSLGLLSFAHFVRLRRPRKEFPEFNEQIGPATQAEASVGVPQVHIDARASRVFSQLWCRMYRHSVANKFSVAGLQRLIRTGQEVRLANGDDTTHGDDMAHCARNGRSILCRMPSRSAIRHGDHCVDSPTSRCRRFLLSCLQHAAIFRTPGQLTHTFPVDAMAKMCVYGLNYVMMNSIASAVLIGITAQYP